MEYPKTWEKEISGWGEESQNEEDIIIVRDEKGEAQVHRMKGVDWAATLAANWKKITAALAGVVATVGMVILLVRVLRGRKR